MDPLSPAPAHAHRLPRWQRRWLYAIGGVLLATGIVWLVVHYGIGADELPHPLEAWSLRLHGLAAFGGVFITGALAAAHIPQGWRLSRRNQWMRQSTTGAWLCAFAALLIFTGYLLYYFAPESVRPVLGWFHAIVGLVMALLMLTHRRGV